jgi:WD40 repeat protein
VAFSPDGRCVASGNGRALSPPSGDVKVWEAATGRTVWTNTHKGPVFGVAFSPTDDALATAAADYLLKLWGASNGGALRARAADGPVNAVTFSDDGRLLASAQGDRTVHVEDARTGEERFVLRGHGAEVVQVAFTPDGKLLASAGVDGTIKFWDMETGKETVWPLKAAP